MTLREWAVHLANPDPFCAPEVGGVRLSGRAWNHPSYDDGDSIETSPVVLVRLRGREVITNSGRVYRLDGPPCADYLAFLAKIGRAHDPDEPIKIKPSGKKVKP